MAVKGIERVKRNYKMVIRNIDQTRTEEAVFTVLSQGATYAQQLTPMDTGTLSDSQYEPQIEQQAGRTIGQVGFTAAYAAAVHNAPGILKGLPRADFGKTRAGVGFGGGSHQGTYWSPDAEPKFLEKGFAKVKPLVPEILEDKYRV